jgi:alkaline phosphatase D
MATAAETDYTLTVPLEGLSPATHYRYHVTIGYGDQSKKEFSGKLAAKGNFLTFPDDNISAAVTFAWSGDLGGQGRCRQGMRGYPIFDVIHQQEIDFFLFLGDTIYADNLCPSPPNEPGADFKATTLQTYRLRHRSQRGADALQQFLRTVAGYAIWDDHEVRDNFSGPFDPDMPAGRLAFRPYWPLAAPA